jgi:predicted  nucleic acid-binding Zn-ribbon protein
MPQGCVARDVFVIGKGKQITPRRLDLHNSFNRATLELAMIRSRINNDDEQMDRKTTRAICEGVGERLQQHMRPETALPTHLERLLEALRRRDDKLH